MIITEAYVVSCNSVSLHNLCSLPQLGSVRPVDMRDLNVEAKSSFTQRVSAGNGLEINRKDFMVDNIVNEANITEGCCTASATLSRDELALKRRYHQEQLAQHCKQEEHHTHEEAFLRSSLRDSERLHALEKNFSGSGVENNGYLFEQEQYKPLRSVTWDNGEVSALEHSLPAMLDYDEVVQLIAELRAEWVTIRLQK